MSTTLFLLLGWLSGLPFVADLSRVWGLLTAVTITAFVGSFIYAFAELGKNEGWQKFALLHAPEFMLGLYIPVAWQEAKLAGMIILIAAGVVHVAIWKASVHSRAFRLRVLTTSKLLESSPNWQKLFFLLNFRDYCNLVDDVVKALGQGQKVKLGMIRKVLPDAHVGLLTEAAVELTKIQQGLYQNPPGVE